MVNYNIFNSSSKFDEVELQTSFKDLFGIMIHFFLFIPPAEVYCLGFCLFFPVFTNNLFFYLTLYRINVFISGKCQIQKYKVYIVLKKQDVLCEQTQTGYPHLMLAIKQNPHFLNFFFLPLFHGKGRLMQLFSV